MKKFLVAFFIFSLFSLFTSKSSKAICYSPGDNGYPSCIGNINAKRCQRPSGGYYSCCNEISDICLFDPNRNTILENTPCGGTSQRCCSNRLCNNSLTCTTTYNGEYCLDQGQIKALKSGSGGTAVTASGFENSALCPDGLSVNTAFGCLAAGNPTKMVSQLLGWGAIVGAGIAFLMIVFAGIQITLAGGDPKKIQAARELITSAITGLILIIFSVFLINLIGVDILGLSKLGFGS